jgi:hypothetical protein
MPITRLVQSERSEETYELTSYLADRYPKIWKEYSGGTKPTPY